MVSSDTVVGIVGAVILTGAMIAVFYYENSNASDDGAADLGQGANLYSFAFARTNDTATGSGSASANAAGTFDFTLPGYVYNIHVLVEWQNDGGGLPGPLQSGRDNLRVFLINETGAEIEQDEGSSGSIELMHAHADDNETTPPMRMRVAADSETQAWATLNETRNAQHGAGGWSVRVEFVNGGTGPTAGQDTSEQYTVTVHYSYWAPELQA